MRSVADHDSVTPAAVFLSYRAQGAAFPSAVWTDQNGDTIIVCKMFIKAEFS